MEDKVLTVRFLLGKDKGIKQCYVKTDETSREYEITNVLNDEGMEELSKIKDSLATFAVISALDLLGTPRLERD